MEDKAEDLRLQGNDAYMTGDFERALDLYQESASYHPKANTLSNTAAVLHKLGYYQKATEAAKRATEVDPKWAKGWWRRGLAAEMVKDFHMAHKYYETAFKLDKKNQVFGKHLDSVRRRLKIIQQENDTGMMAVQQQPEQTIDLMDTDSIKAYLRAQARLGGPIYTLDNRYGVAEESSGAPFPTSEQYLFHGIIWWITGLKCAIADLSASLDARDHRFSEEIKHHYHTNTLTLDAIAASEQRLGGLPTGSAFDHMISAFANLGGQKVFVEIGPGRICPRPESLRRYNAFQILAQLGCIQKWMDIMQEREFDFGPGMKCAPGVVQAYGTFFSNLGAPPILDITGKSRKHTPQEIVDYVKEQVRSGRTWDKNGGLRSYCAWQYRGPILYASVLRGMNVHKHAYENLKWAREFITLLDEEFKVMENESFDVHGSVFRKSLRIGIILAELDLLNSLRGTESTKVDGPYPMSEVIDLCLEISAMAKIPEDLGAKTEYRKALNEYAYCHRPLAVAHSVIAHNLNILRCMTSPNLFLQIAQHHGLVLSLATECDPFALIANHYHIAAENELPDAADGAIYWWAYAATMAQADSPQRTLGELRSAVSTAKANEEARNIDLFGDNMQKNGEFESIARLTAAHFEDQPDSFVFPKVVLDSKQSTLTIDGTIICDDFEQYRRNELKMLHQEKAAARLNELMNTSELEKEFGRVVKTEPPSLATLSVRELHKAGATFARGETNGDAIIQKAMEEAIDKENAGANK